MRKFSENSSAPQRALQAWQILISKAANRQTITYIELAKLMGYTDARPMSQILDPIMKYCDQNGLAPLTALVVSKERGAPGDGLTTVKDIDADREKVFGYDWYALVPPTPEEFQAAKQKK